MKKSDVELFNKIYAQLEGLHTEISLLSKKSPTDAVNIFKLKLTNSVLEAANKFLVEKNKPFDHFIVFSEDDLPNNSDVAMVLSQYIGCMEKLRESNIRRYGSSWYWEIDGQRSEIVTFPPNKIKE